MSDFGDFNSSNDPTADFLARERAVLGEDADLFASGDASNTTPGLEADLMTSPTVGDALPATSPGVSSAISPQGVTSPSGGEYSAFESEFPKAEELETSQVSQGQSCYTSIVSYSLYRLSTKQCFLKKNPKLFGKSFLYISSDG